jgi:alginate O-acetyltransferase complex protein AlgI
MLFQTLDFAVFLPVVFGIYWLLHRHFRLQNLWVVIASQVFYGWWDWRFLLLIWASALLDFFVGLRLESTDHPGARRNWVALSLVGNLGMLGYFKYAEFFVENFTRVFRVFGAEIPSAQLDLILPVGISFYTFQTMSYSLDVYRKEIRASRDIVEFMAYVSFFPQLVAGPIERAKNLLGQFQRPRELDFERAKDGLRQILWGLCKKVLVADACGLYVQQIYHTPESYTGAAVAIAIGLSLVQIYGDFSGYSDIAIGTGRLFGIDLMRNFDFPLFATSVRDFWQRWHISLMQWFRDYVYRPLGGSRGGRVRQYRNITIVFLLSAFWHGPSWAFVAWGAYSAMTYLLSVDRPPRPMTFRNLGRSAWVFLVVALGTVFFRARDFEHAQHIVVRIFDSAGKWQAVPAVTWLPLLVMLAVEWQGRRDQHGLEKFLMSRHPLLRWSFYYLLIGAFLVMGGHAGKPFVYFRF